MPETSALENIKRLEKKLNQGDVASAEEVRALIAAYRDFVRASDDVGKNLGERIAKKHKKLLNVQHDLEEARRHIELLIGCMSVCPFPHEREIRDNAKAFLAKGIVCPATMTTTPGEDAAISRPLQNVPST